MATNSWEELQAQIIAQALEDEGFRTGVMDDPKAAIAAKFGVNLPAELEIQVHEDTATTAHLVLPATGKLREADLLLAAGGDGPRPGVASFDYFDSLRSGGSGGDSNG